MRQTVIGIFNSYVEATRAQKALVDAGFQQVETSIYSTALSPSAKPGPRAYAHDAGEMSHDKLAHDQLERLFARLFRQGEYPAETEHYRELIRRGGAMVIIDVSDVDVDVAQDVMNRSGALDIDECAAAWRREGVQSRTAGTEDSLPARGAGDDASFASGPSQTAGMPSGTREDRMEAPNDMRRGDSASALRRGESADAQEVGDPLQSPAPWDEYGVHEDEFRRDYDARYANTGAPYEDYQRAYQHGATVGRDERYRDHDWPDAEADVRKHWETHYPESGWERFKAAVRHGWERVRGRGL